MNKYKEAFNHIVDYGVEVEYFNKQADKPEEESTIMIVSKALDKLETCIELLDKETSRKASKNLFGRLACDNCGISFQELGQQTYCKHCGQKIDWREGK